MDTEPPSLLFTALFTYTQITSSVVLVILLACSAMISGAEVAFFSLTSSDFEANGERTRSKKLEIVQKLLARPKKLLATILVSNNFINIAIVLLFDSLTDVLFATIDSVFFGISLRFIVEVGVVTFLILLFGEILPKIYASRNKVLFATFMAYPLNVLDYLLSPVSLPMRSVTLYMQGRFGKQRSNISVDQLSQALELTSEDKRFFKVLLRLEPWIPSK